MTTAAMCERLLPQDEVVVTLDGPYVCIDAHLDTDEQARIHVLAVNIDAFCAMLKAAAEIAARNR